MVDPKGNNDTNKELIEALKTEEEYEYEEKKDGKFVNLKLKKILFFLIIITILLIIVLWLFSLTSSKEKDDYSKYEDKMISAAKNYYKVNKSSLPEKNQSSEITLDKLIELKYLANYSQLKSCTGSVTVENVDNSYQYTSYLDCEDKYSSKVLVNKLISSDNIVTSDSGLYSMNNEYVYRGEEPNNYVSFGDRLWRIVKIDSNKDIVLITKDFYYYSNIWDDRYNSDIQRDYGYNIYEKSRIKEFLDDVYTNSINNIVNEKYDIRILSKKNASKLLGYKLCIGKVDINQTVNNNTYECSRVLENTKLGLLTVSDYVNASTDSNCKTPDSISCKNYNYLVKQASWWLVSGSNSSTYEAYLVNSTGVIEKAKTSRTARIRPVIHLSSNTRYTSGKGTFNKPYVIK